MGNAIAGCLGRKQEVDSHPWANEAHGVTPETAGFAALARDLFHFETTGQVPAALKGYVKAAKARQAIWYGKLLSAWKDAKPPPRNAADAYQLVTQTLSRIRKVDLQGLLDFYGFSQYPEAPVFSEENSSPQPVPWPNGVQYELCTLPIENRQVADGDTITVYVEVKKNPREAASVPASVLEIAEKRRVARKQRNFKTADALQKEILSAGYKIFDSIDGHDDVLAHKYRIRLRGVDAPESAMPFGAQAKAMLVSLVEGQKLRVLVFNTDQYGRHVADIHSKQGFIQELLLKRGGAWHYTAYDHRPEFTKWEQEARNNRIGLWALPNPQKPWEYRKNQK